ncbi:MAG: argininosuccinate lyase [Bacteroidales bacterium]|nr:argininosuccinate lyase [Bacteroidales bacterium]
MHMKLWEKGQQLDKAVENFTIGNDTTWDMELVSFDIIGSIAHTKMLTAVKLLTKQEETLLVKELINLYKEVENKGLIFEEGVEDVHSQVEKILTDRLGEMGKKIHTARSRNDQILLDLRLYSRNEIKHLVERANELFLLLIELSEKYKEVILPGYTHYQVAMPSSFGLWFGAYAESLTDDLILLSAAYRIVNQNPLGSAAGYGSSFPIRRDITTQLLGFGTLSYNSIYAQMGRGKTEKVVAFALSSIAATLSKLAMDVCLFSSQNFDFFSFPDEFTTGSSIMPHKKNPDVFELIRAKCNKIQSVPNDIALITANLPSGYHRDFQILKEIYLPAFSTLADCIQMTILLLSHIKIKNNILDEKRYKYMFSVEEINKKVKAGMSFREAYKEVAKEIAENKYQPDKKLLHTHEGSIGNLCNDKIRSKMEEVISEFDFSKADEAIKNLLRT